MNLLVEWRMRVKILAEESRNGDMRNLKKLRDHIGIDMFLRVGIPNEHPLYTSQRSRTFRINRCSICHRRRIIFVIIVEVELWLHSCGGGDGDAVRSNDGEVVERPRKMEETAKSAGRGGGEAAEDSHYLIRGVTGLREELE